MSEPIGVFRVDKEAKNLEQLNETDLAAHGLKERYDLQEWVEKYPQILGEDLLIVSKECSSFDQTNERVDLVALDSAGSLVVIELKRDDSGTEVHWQAIKYASYFAKATPDFIVGLLAKHSGVSKTEAEQAIRAFTQLDDLSDLNRKQRIILASHRFAREVTSAVLWLLGYGVDIKCVQLTPFSDQTTGSFYLQSTTIIPVPGSEGYEVTTGLPTETPASASGRAKYDDITRFMASIVSDASSMVDENLRPDRHSRWAGAWSYYRYYHAWYSHEPWSNWGCSYQINYYAHGEERTLSIKFEMNPSEARKNGWTKSDLDAVTKLVQGFGQEHKSAVIDEEGRLGAEHVLPAASLDDALRESATRVLAKLIGCFTPEIERITSSHNEESE